MLPLGEETAVHIKVGSIVWTFRRLKKPRCREMSARGYTPFIACAPKPLAHGKKEGAKSCKNWPNDFD